MQPCQRHTDDSSASRESSGSETKGVKSLGERKRGRKEEGGKVGDGQKRKDGKKGERFGCATVLFTAALTQNRTWLSQIV